MDLHKNIRGNQDRRRINSNRFSKWGSYTSFTTQQVGSLATETKQFTRSDSFWMHTMTTIRRYISKCSTYLFFDVFCLVCLVQMLLTKVLHSVYLWCSMQLWHRSKKIWPCLFDYFSMLYFSLAKESLLACPAARPATAQCPGGPECWETEVDMLVAWTYTLSLKELEEDHSSKVMMMTPPRA